MGREPNTVKSNVVANFLDVSVDDHNLEVQPSDFQDDFDSTVLV